ncbi:MAG: endonuclease III [Candidatus Symbiothrix sp.]|nr:endonuclease III [Candidatus Symbiothrix sp.]
MNIKTRYKKVIEWFEVNMPVAKSELHYNNPFQLLISVILAAQCTDKRINIITPALFRDFPTPEVLAASNPETIFEYIKTATYPNSKATHLVGMAQKLIADYGGKVPATIEELMKLPGVGKKTANVVASVAFDVPALAVDTHVFRVSNRIGLTHDSKTPLETERELTKYIPKQLWSTAHHWLILHGRYVCVARKPKCETCGLFPYCERNGL